MLPVTTHGGLKKYGLIGRKLGHSLSQELFEAQGFKDATYGLYEMATLDGLRQWVEQEHISGFNVTIPYKQAIMPLLDAVCGTAAEIGAVNCVSAENGRLTGYNTDAPAFMQTFERCLASLPPHTPPKALILGTGGAARAVAYALRQLGIEHVYVSRHPGHAPVKPVIGYGDITPEYSIIINATPVGMFPDIDNTPISLSPTLPHPSLCLVYDLVYNPSITLLMRQAEALGAKVENGLGMLRRQAELSWNIWGA